MTKRIFLALTVVSLAISSCSKEDINESNLETRSEVSKNILNFNSEEEIDSKIRLIQTLKNEKEKSVLDEMFNSKNASAIELTEQTKLTDDLINYAKKYHQRKLENVYSIREELGFTSIQSIADEINSLKLIDPSRASQLLSKHGQYLNQGQFLVEPTITSDISEVLNLEGKLMLNNDLKDYKSVTISNRNGHPVSVKEGILASNIFYAITWHAGFNYDHIPGALNHIYTPFTKLASFVNIGGGYFIYPSRFDLAPNQVDEAVFSFPVGAGLFDPVGSSTSNQTVIFRGNYSPIPIVNTLPPYLHEINTYGIDIEILAESHSSFQVKKVQLSASSFNTFTDIAAINPHLNLTNNPLYLIF